MKNKNFKFSLLDYYVEKHHIAPENVEDKVREDMNTMGISIFSDFFSIRPTKNRDYDCFGEKYSEIFRTFWCIVFDCFDGSIYIEPIDAHKYTVPFTAEIWELMIHGDIEVQLGITDSYSYLNVDEFDYIMSGRRSLNNRFFYYKNPDKINYYIDITKGNGSISIEKATIENMKTLAFHIAEKAGYIYSKARGAKLAASHLAISFGYKIV